MIPCTLRRKYSIKEGAQVAFLEQENRWCCNPSHRRSFAASAAPSKANRLQ